MAISEAELRRGLAAEEPDYPGMARRIDGANTALLAELAKGPDPMLASKAVYLASLSSDLRARAIVLGASASRREVVRIAAASALENLPAAQKAGLVEKLLGDDSVSVQKLALRNVSQMNPRVRARVERLSRESEVEMIRTLSAQKLAQPD